MAYKQEVGGINRSTSEPSDEMALHTKDVGHISTTSDGQPFHVNDFIDEYYQMPNSRYFGTLDIEKVQGLPNLKSQEVKSMVNPAMEKMVPWIDFGSDFSPTQKSVKELKKDFNNDGPISKKYYKLMQIFYYFQAWYEETMKYASIYQKQFDIKWSGNISNK
jgi:hypothetical protein